jgi:hypothetical protein
MGHEGEAIRATLTSWTVKHPAGRATGGVPFHRPCGMTSMNSDLEMISNFHERAVFQAIREARERYPQLAQMKDLLPDIACVALNRLPPRYIRHEVDFSFYLTDGEREATEKAVFDAVNFAIEFVQARVAMRARH